MTRLARTLLCSLVVPVAVSSAFVACSSSDVQPMGDGGTTSASGSGGSGGGISLDGGGGATVCDTFPLGGDAGDSAAVQARCEPGVTNPAECPATRPTAGDPCPGISNGTQCMYQDTRGYELDTCDGMWGSGGHTCLNDCKTMDPVEPIANGPACGSLPDIPCVTTLGTDQERANATLVQIAQCCGAHPEEILMVSLQDGCATASAGPKDLADCMNGLLAGRRIQCAAALPCMIGEWSTLK